MNKHTKYCHIAELKKGVVFSDPSYEETIWCQYRKEFQANDWLMKVESSVEDGILRMNICLGRATFSRYVKTQEMEKGLSITHPRRYEIKETELGIDTARIFLGTKENWEQFREEASVYTAADGLFGDLLEFTCKGENTPCGYVMIASVDASLTNSQELFQLLSQSFSGKEITKGEYLEAINPEKFSFKQLEASEAMHSQKALLQEQNTAEHNKQDLER